MGVRLYRRTNWASKRLGDRIPAPGFQPQSCFRSQGCPLAPEQGTPTLPHLRARSSPSAPLEPEDFKILTASSHRLLISPKLQIELYKVELCITGAPQIVGISQSLQSCGGSVGGVLGTSTYCVRRLTRFPLQLQILSSTPLFVSCSKKVLHGASRCDTLRKQSL